MADRGRMLAPGIYGKDDELHVDVPEVCEYLGVPATHENQQAVIAAAMRLGRVWGIPEVEIRDEERLN